MLEMLISWSEMRIIVTLVVGLENGWLCPVFQTVLVARLDTCSWVCPSVPVSQSVLLCHHALAQVTQGQGGGPRPADCWCRGIRCEGGDKTRSLNIPWSDPSQGYPVSCLLLRRSPSIPSSVGASRWAYKGIIDWNSDNWNDHHTRWPHVTSDKETVKH